MELSPTTIENASRAKELVTGVRRAAKTLRSSALDALSGATTGAEAEARRRARRALATRTLADGSVAEQCIH